MILNKAQKVALKLMGLEPCCDLCSDWERENDNSSIGYCVCGVRQRHWEGYLCKDFVLRPQREENPDND